MRLTWTPPGSDPRDLTFRVEDLTPDLYEPIEQVGPWNSLSDFADAMQSGNRRAWRVALWTCLRRDDDPTLQLDDVQPTPAQLTMRYEPEEELLIAEAILTNPDLAPDRRAFWEEQLPALRAAAGKADPGDEASPPGDAPTAGTSPTSSG
jgi:hypothetical protein